jgi:hypothetical protein
MKCPICENEVKEYSNDYMEHTLCEEYAKCEDEHHYYAYQYAYGSTEEIIGRTTFHSHYADSQELRKLQNEQYKAVLKLEKDFYRKAIDKR